MNFFLRLLWSIAVLALPGCPPDDGPKRPASTDREADSDSAIDQDTETDSGKIFWMDCAACEEKAEGWELENLRCAFDLCDGPRVLGNEYVVRTPLKPGRSAEETRVAVQRFGDVSNDLARKLRGSYVVMATGRALGTEHSSWIDTALQGLKDPVSTDEATPCYDVVEWQLRIEAPMGVNAFRFKYVFFSEEYDEFISEPFNDKFYALLEAKSTNDGRATAINFSECRDPNAYSDFICGTSQPGCKASKPYCYIAVNTAYSECCWYGDCPAQEDRTDISGTGFECALASDLDGDGTGSSTGWLETTWPIEGGETFAITFHLHDTNDGRLDSAVILDGFEFLTGNFRGTVPVI